MSGIRAARRVQRIKIDAASSGDNTIVTVVAGTRIIVTSVVLVAAAAVSVKWKSGSTDLSGAMPFAANGGYALSGNREDPVLSTAVQDEDLILNLSGAVQVSGHINYIVIEAVSLA